MPKIQIPQNVSVSDDSGNSVELEFVRDFVLRTVLRDASFGADSQAVFACFDARSLFLNAKPGDVVDVTHDLLDRLQKAVRKPSAGYNPAIAYALVPFMRAFLEA